MPSEKEVFKSVSWDELGKLEKASKKLIEPTKRVVKNALRLVRQGDYNSLGQQEVFVKDPKTKQVFFICDLYARERLTPSSSPSEHSLTGSLLIDPVIKDSEGIDVVVSGISLPHLPEFVTIANISSLKGIDPQAMKKVARQLKRAILLK